MTPLELLAATLAISVGSVVQAASGVGAGFLIVRAFGVETRDRKIDQLRQSLASTVTMARQLEISPERALILFKEMLEENQTPDTPSEATSDEPGDDPKDEPS